MKTGRTKSAYVNLAKASAVTVGVTAGILSVTYPKVELGLDRAAAQSKLPPPNVVVIMADDLSVGELKVVLSKGWMPNLKTHLIDRATTFDQSFVSYSLCCPSRSTFLTGQYPHNHGVLDNIRPNGGVTQLQDSSTLATWLKRVGYRTGLVGKYLNPYGQNWVAGDPSDNPTYIPPGWDDWQAVVSPLSYYSYRINDNKRLVKYSADLKDYNTDVMARRSVSFINESEALSDAKPFFLFVAPFAPHLPATPAPRHAGMASSIPLPQPPSFNERVVVDKPAWLRREPKRSPTILAERYRHRLESLRAVDDLVGSVISALRRNRELNNTVLIFTSDNGHLLGEHRLIGKVAVYEESIRVPLYIRAPGLPKQRSSNFVINNDLAPTIADFAGTTPDILVDGRSLTPLLRDPNLANWRKRFLVENYNTRLNGNSFFAVRTSPRDTATPNQVYVKYAGGEQEFYDLAIDPYQVQSLHNEPNRRQKQMQILRSRLSSLTRCSGRSCRTLEDD